jgi:hypothetical protein
LVKCRGMLVNSALVLTILWRTDGVGEHQIEFAREDAAGSLKARCVIDTRLLP